MAQKQTNTASDTFFYNSQDPHIQVHLHKLHANRYFVTRPQA